MLLLFYRVNSLGKDLGITVTKETIRSPRDKLLSWFGDKETIIKFFGALATEFGPYFPSYLSLGAKTGIRFRDVPAMVNICQASKLC